MARETIVDFDNAKNKALSILSRHMHTKKQLRDKLIRYGADEDVADEVILWAEEYKFVNDEEYARIFANECIRTKKYGMRRIKQALAFKGIDRYVIEDILCELDVDEGENLLPLVEKKLSGNFDRKNIDKTIRHFVMKGYDFSDIKNAIDKIRQNEGDY